MTFHEAQRAAVQKLSNIYSNGEASTIADWLCENISGLKKTDRSSQKDKILTPEQEDRFHQSIHRLLDHEPIQYVLNEAWFCGLKFYVDNNVLIPRPETEELVEWIITNCKFPLDELSILDIGTGSGCIPIALKRRLRKATVWSCDTSIKALEVAKRNAESLGTEVNFIELNFLDPSKWESLPNFDIVVSNPPYIPDKEKYSMPENVVAYEPRVALFVPDEDPLVFYKAIAEFGKTHLNRSGSIFTEIHESLGEAVISIFQASGYNCEMKKDMQLKDRMIRASDVSHKDH